MTFQKQPFVRVAVVLAAMATLQACAGRERVPLEKESSMSAMKGSHSADVVREFFAAFGRGDVEGVIGTFHPEARIVAVRQTVRKENELYGSYEGKEGARAMLTTLGKLFDTQAFSVDQVLGEGAFVFASGSFVHQVKSTGKPFRSDWALRCEIKDGKILQYRFFEDSAAYVEASR